MGGVAASVSLNFLCFFQVSVPPSIIFPRLKSVDLENLKYLKHFHTHTHTSFKDNLLQSLVPLKPPANFMLTQIKWIACNTGRLLEVDAVSMRTFISLNFQSILSEEHSLKKNLHFQSIKWRWWFLTYFYYSIKDIGHNMSQLSFISIQMQSGCMSVM